VAEPYRDQKTFGAPRAARQGAVVGAIVMIVLIAKVLTAWGFKATIAGLFGAGVIFLLYYQVLRPRLVVRAEGIEVINGWRPVKIPWRDVQRIEVGPKGTLVVSRGGTETLSRFPAGTPSAADSEADRAAKFLAACMTWGRRGGEGPMPMYEPPAKPADR
jgi:hypothetical protein